MFERRAGSMWAPLLAAASLRCGGSPPPAALPPAVTSAQPDAPASVANLVARHVFFDGPDRSDVQVSPDGKRIGWLAPAHGAPNVWVGPSEAPQKAQALTHETGEGVRWWRWTFGSDRVVFARGREGGESDLVEADIAKGVVRDLTPREGVRGGDLVELSPKRPAEALVAFNDRNKQFPDVYLVDLAAGTRQLVQQNDGGYDQWLGDEDLRVRVGIKGTADGGREFFAIGRGKQAARRMFLVPAADRQGLRSLGFDASGDSLFLEDSRNRDTAALFTVDTMSGQPTFVVGDKRADIGTVLVHPTSKVVEAASFLYDEPAWNVVDSSVEGDLYYLHTFGDAMPVVTSRSLDEQRWLVAFPHSDGPTRYYRYDRNPDVPGNPGAATLLFESQEALEGAKLSAARAVVIKARDGLDLVSYLILPVGEDPRGDGRPKAPLPMVVWVHDGPWARTGLEFGAEQQWLASRGYAVLSVNYRGSAGFGKAFLGAGNLEWGGKMRDDLLDAASWAVREKVADPGKVAVMGTGYGGYAVLSALAMAPSPFACGVDVGGPPDLLSYVQSASTGREHVEVLAARVGDPRTEEGKRLLAERSPVAHVGSIVKPLLIGQGKKDPWVAEAAVARFAAVLDARHAPVTYVAFPDEGRGIERPANRVGFAAVAEVFLSQCLGGPYLGYGDDLAGSTLTVPVGAERIYGLGAALGPRK
ncbi:MAG TPA: prolyl oligopeptidase family serine peptidase [Polyangiaceae bacterium]|nr:prolyl oligopeptidase family serine peptidase [Polyangiaceae bacterium]